MNDIAFYFLLFLSACVGYAINKVISKNFFELNPSDLEGLSKWAVMLCRAAKNMTGVLSSGYARRNWVMDQITNFCEKYHIDLTDEQKRALLEAAYDQMKAEDAKA